jgi:site-specific recombinase XerD
MDCTALTVVEQPALPAELAATLELAADFAKASKAKATQEAYGSDFRIFEAWCRARGLSALPATAASLCAFLADQAALGKRASTLGRRLAAVRYFHRAAGHETPTGDEKVKAVLSGIRRTIGAAPVRKKAATSDIVLGMVGGKGRSLRELRDRAILLLGFAGAFRRSELCALEVADLTETPDGLRVLIRRSKGDQEGQGAEVAILRGCRLRPVEAVQMWLAATEICTGPVFRPVLQGQRVQAVPLSAFSAAQIVKAYVERAGLDPVLFARHSLRSGFLRERRVGVRDDGGVAAPL